MTSRFSGAMMTLRGPVGLSGEGGELGLADLAVRPFSTFFARPIERRKLEGSCRRKSVSLFTAAATWNPKPWKSRYIFDSILSTAWTFLQFKPPNHITVLLPSLIVAGLRKNELLHFNIATHNINLLPFWHNPANADFACLFQQVQRTREQESSPILDLTRAVSKTGSVNDFAQLILVLTTENDWLVEGSSRPSLRVHVPAHQAWRLFVLAGKGTSTKRMIVFLHWDGVPLQQKTLSAISFPGATPISYYIPLVIITGQTDSKATACAFRLLIIACGTVPAASRSMRPWWADLHWWAHLSMARSCLRSEF